jgi:hypothetical protein
MDTGRSPLSQKLRISSLAPAEMTVKAERTLPRIRNVNEVYHPWDPFKEMRGERKRRITVMRRKGRKKAKMAKKGAAALPVQATPDSAVAADTGPSIDQGVVSDSQMVDHILRQLESPSGTESIRPALQSSPFEDQTNVLEPVETTATEVEFPHPEIPTTTSDSSDISTDPSSSPELLSTQPAPSQITTEEEKLARLKIETKSDDPNESTTKEEQSLPLEIPSQPSNLIETAVEDETPQRPPFEEKSDVKEMTTLAPEAPPKKGRGRPKGSKNRPKD